MKGTGERADAGFDRLVRQELGRDAAPPMPCPQIELLAAWYDRSLPQAGAGSRFASAADREEAAAIEAHLAACDRCRQVVAGLAASEPDVLYVHPQHTSEPARSWSWHLRWLAPLSAAAAIILVAIVGTQVFRGPQPVSVASSRPVPDAAVAEPQAERQSSPLPSTDQKMVPRAEPPARGKREAEGAAETRPKTKGLAGAPPAGSPRREQFADAAPAKPQVAGKIEVPTAAPTQMMAESGAARAEVAAPAPRPVAAPPSPMIVEDKAERGTQMRAVAVGATAPPAFTAGGEVGWRYARPGTVYRTDDGGRNWKVQALPSQARLAVLSPVSALVCWGAGPHGVIVRTTDGATWQLVPPPVQADFASLTADGADRASVGTADGATYDTADGGRTWHRR